MSNHYYNEGATHNDHHKELNISGSITAEQLKLIAADFFANDTDNPTQQPSDTLTPSRREALDRLLACMDRAPWNAPASTQGVRHFLLTVFAAEGGTPLTSKEDTQLSEKLWQLMERGRGDRVEITAMNLAGYFVSKRLIAQSSPAIAKAMFGSKEGYSNINKGNPDCQTLPQGLADVVPLLDKWIDEATRG